MNWLKTLCRKKFKVGQYFGSTPYELKAFTVGIGNSEINEKEIVISKYPFQPSKYIQVRKFMLPKLMKLG